MIDKLKKDAPPSAAAPVTNPVVTTLTDPLALTAPPLTGDEEVVELEKVLNELNLTGPKTGGSRSRRKHKTRKHKRSKHKRSHSKHKRSKHKRSNT